jgi:hypothetical protein
MNIKSRIRWNKEEQEAVVAAAREHAAKGGKTTSEQRLSRAQNVLPKNRRRPFNANLASWLTKATRGDLPAPKVRGASATGAGLLSSSLNAALIEAGIGLLKGVLADPGVQQALRDAIGGGKRKSKAA